MASGTRSQSASSPDSIVLDDALRRSVTDTALTAATEAANRISRNTVRELIPETAHAAATAALAAATRHAPTNNVIKLNDFWDTKAEAWFRITEATFDEMGVTDDVRKFNAVLHALNARIADQLPETLERTYDSIKSTLLRIFTPPIEVRAAGFTSLPSLDQLSPNQLMTHFIKLIGKDDPRDILLELYFQKMPTYARGMLRKEKHRTFAEIGNLAEDLVATRRPQLNPTSPAIFNTFQPGHSNDSFPTYQNIDHVGPARLSGRGQRGARRGRGRGLFPRGSRPPRGHRGGSRGNARGQRGQTQRGAHQQQRSKTQNFCFYHASFCHDAIKCRLPCGFADFFGYYPDVIYVNSVENVDYDDVNHVQTDDHDPPPKPRKTDNPGCKRC